VVSLFTGAGGLDIAICRSAEVAELFSTDSNPIFLQTTIENMPKHFPNVRHTHCVCDVRELTGSMIRRRFANRPDLVIGGPPCDDFTRFGRRKGLGGDKGPLVFEFARIVAELRPRCFVFENVPTLPQMFDNAFRKLLACFRDAGYEPHYRTLAAWAYGAPTLRERVFVVGFKDTKTQSAWSGFPDPTHSRADATNDLFSSSLPFTPTLRQVLDDLPDVEDPRAALFSNHQARLHRPATIEHLRQVPAGMEVARSFRYRPAMDGLCRSLTAGLDDSTKAYIHPLFHREMTVREYARIQGFPDSWAFAGTLNNGIKQVANAVPIPMGEVVLRGVTGALEPQHVLRTR
jgi:DNA (cytosine-5)-methyltransferase 1